MVAGPPEPPAPLLLVPGLCGTMLNVRDVGSSDEGVRAWVSVQSADSLYRQLWARYDASRGSLTPLSAGKEVLVPRAGDASGLAAITDLDPEASFAVGAVHYYDAFVAYLTGGVGAAYEPGRDLFGFGFDFRESNRSHVGDLVRALERISAANGGAKVDVVTHSMGGLVVRSLLADRPDDYARLVRRWVALGAPFDGAPGYGADALLTGVQFAGSLGAYFFVDRGTFRQLCAQSPSVHEVARQPKDQDAERGRAGKDAEGNGKAAKAGKDGGGKGSGKEGESDEEEDDKGGEAEEEDDARIRLSLLEPLPKGPWDEDASGDEEEAGDGGERPGGDEEEAGDGGERPGGDEEEAGDGGERPGGDEEGARDGAEDRGGDETRASRVTPPLSSASLRSARRPGRSLGRSRRGKSTHRVVLVPTVNEGCELGDVPPPPPPLELGGQPGLASIEAGEESSGRTALRGLVGVQGAVEGAGAGPWRTHDGARDSPGEDATREGWVDAGLLATSDPQSRGGSSAASGPQNCSSAASGPQNGSSAASGPQNGFSTTSGPQTGSSPPPPFPPPSPPASVSAGVTWWRRVHQYDISMDHLEDLLAVSMSGNSVVVDGSLVQLPLSWDVVRAARASQAAWRSARLPPGACFFNGYGTGYGTPHSVSYGSWWWPVSSAAALARASGSFDYVDGDGTVPAASAAADGLDACERRGFPVTHQGLLQTQAVWDAVLDWINDPNPMDRKTRNRDRETRTKTKHAESSGRTGDAKGKAETEGSDKTGDAKGKAETEGSRAGGKSERAQGTRQVPLSSSSASCSSVGLFSALLQASERIRDSVFGRPEGDPGQKNDQTLRAPLLDPSHATASADPPTRAPTQPRLARGPACSTSPSSSLSSSPDSSDDGLAASEGSGPWLMVPKPDQVDAWLHDQ